MKCVMKCVVTFHDMLWHALTCVKSFMTCHELVEVEGQTSNPTKSISQGFFLMPTNLIPLCLYLKHCLPLLETLHNIPRYMYYVANRPLTLYPAPAPQKRKKMVTCSVHHMETVC